MKAVINGVSIHYEITGNGPDMLVLHGWAGCINSMAPIIQEYSKNYRVIALDFPNHGDSDTALDWDVTEYMENLYSFITELKLKDITVISHSFGGRVAILLSSTHPRLVKKLILIDSGGIIPKRNIKYYVKLYGYKIGKQFMKLAIRNKEEYNKWLDTERKKRGSNDYNALSPELRGTFIKIINQNLKPYLKNITAPTLILWGEFDNSTPVYMGKILNKGIKYSTLYILENTGHFSYLDDFASTKKHIDKFLEI